MVKHELCTANEIVWLNITLGNFLLFLSSFESLLSFNYSGYCLANGLAIICNQDYAFEIEKPLLYKGKHVQSLSILFKCLMQFPKCKRRFVRSNIKNSTDVRWKLVWDLRERKVMRHYFREYVYCNKISNNNSRWIIIYISLTIKLCEWTKLHYYYL